jgi:hypothetical protein
MNSLLQSLYMTPEFRHALYQYDYNDERDPSQDDCIPYQVNDTHISITEMQYPCYHHRDVCIFGWIVATIICSVTTIKLTCS